MTFKYSKELIENFENPKNIGTLKNYTVKNEGYNEKDGDWMEFYLLIYGDTVKDIKYMVKGCPRAIASCSFTSELLKGKKIPDIVAMNDSKIRETLDLVDPKFKCVSLPLKIIQDALRDYHQNR